MAERAESYYPSTVKEHFKVFYFKTIDVVRDALKERFHQVLYLFLYLAEQLVIKSINGKSYQKEYDYFMSVYPGDVGQQHYSVTR